MQPSELDEQFIDESSRRVVSSISFVPTGGFSLQPHFQRVSREEIEQYERELAADQPMEDQMGPDPSLTQPLDFQEEYFRTLQSQVDFDDPVTNAREEDEEEDESTYALAPDDVMMVMNCNSPDFTTLNVQIHSHATGDAETYLHHNIVLPDHCLCVDWMSFDPSDETRNRNFALVGTFSPAVSIWDLDVIDTIRPVATLQGVHSSGVMSVGWSRQHRNLVASGSEDCSMAVWDLRNGRSVAQHSLPGKVNRVRWNNTWVLTTTMDEGNFVYVLDPRRPTNASTRIPLKSPPEDAIWHPAQSQQFFVSQSTGHVCWFDVRNPSSPVQVFVAHQQECNSLAFSDVIPNMLFTAGGDGLWKVWNIGQRKMVFERSMGSKDVYEIQTQGNLVAVGGDNINVVYNLYRLPQFRELFDQVRSAQVETDTQMEVEGME